MLWQDRLLKTNVPSTAQTLLPEASTPADALRVSPAVLVKLAGETYKEELAASTVPTKPAIDKKMIVDNIIFLLVFFIFLYTPI
ncbi:MAG: hypothetical protein A2117_00045 [Candidatus Wildermuthbacteria bacterium GWA2_46_15]|uniref:Uncharacterized protein n=1 Tax=Candidatus Wildermuthbacteria bacterium GWA2_46_15 TaxID=1802443 RepID=A0A1G2QMV0_9BACT|nr:MAG: hypothetical protein A2117_00045 [Candidatus Wildermuthbacteria bacterium GWA2_46_15]